MARRTATEASGKDPVPAGGTLVTGFEPFGGEDMNPSWEICGRLPAAIGHARIDVLRVPAEVSNSAAALATAIDVKMTAGKPD